MSMMKMTGVRVPHHKHSAGLAPVRLPVPQKVVLPMSMHIGAPAKPVVKRGDHVDVGQLIAEPGGFVSAPIHASVSGTVKRLGFLLNSGGQKVPTVEIESDGLQTPYEGLQAPTVTDQESFLKAVRDSGVVGLGGAGFPTSVKLSVKDLSKIEAVIINGAECEPYITSDTRTMLDRSEEVCQGIAMLETYLQAKRIIIGIEENKPDCISLYRKLFADSKTVEVKSLPSVYPQGGEKVLIYNTTGRIVPEGKLPIDAGAIVINCTTLAVIAQYVRTGMPLVEKCVTVDGSAIEKPQNVIAPIGTPIRVLVDFVQPECKAAKVLYGGPMMGISVPNMEHPILKSTNAVTLFAEKDAVLPQQTACIHCGRCIAHCPMHLMPTAMDRAYRMGDYEKLEALKVNLCMECGCCSFICPAKRYLVQTNKLAKAGLRAYQAEKKAQAERDEARRKAREAKEQEAKTE